MSEVTVPVNTIPETGRRNFCRLLCSQMLRDLKSYLLEYSCPAAFASDESTQLAVESIKESIGTHDVVVYMKQGCGFCLRAKEMLDTQKSQGVVFSRSEIDGTSLPFRAALQSVTRAHLSFPVIFIRGRLIGGTDELAAAISADRLPVLLASDMAPLGDQDVAERSAGLQRAQQRPPDLFHVPRGGRWYCPQMYTYSNFVRGISAIHCAIFAVLLILIGSGDSVSETAADVLSLYFLAELCVYVLLGPTPFSPLGCVVACVLWRFRGNSTSSLPYKFIFLLYAISISRTLARGERTRDNRGLLISGLINSSLLAVLRF